MKRDRLKKPGRPRKGKERSVVVTARIQPDQRDKLLKKYRSVSQAIQALVNHYTN